MTTAAQVKKLVRPLLARHPELVLIGRMIVIAPVRHVLRAIYIDRTRSGDQFNPRWAVIHLFEHSRSVWFNLGGDIYKPRPTPWHDRYPTLWWINDPETPELLAETIETVVLPKLEPLHELEAFYQHLISVKDHAYHLRPYQRVIVEAARGRLNDVRHVCCDELSRWSDKDEYVRLPRQICARLAANDIAAVAALLHDWEATTVRNLKIEHLWKPTPFPLETGCRR